MRRSPLERVIIATIIGMIVITALSGIAAIYINEKHSDSSSRYYNGSSTKTDEKQKNDGDDPSGYYKVEDDGTYRVVEVIDGDTIKVQYGNEVKKVRLIGIDAPETVDPNKGKECYGEEASNYLKDKLTDKDVLLATDSSQDNIDAYGRLLRYVILDGMDINADLISNGYAREYTYEKDYVRKDTYLPIQENAKKNKLGLWSDQCAAETNNDSEPASNEPSVQPEDRSNCLIKGNISQYTGEKIYHVPGQKYYDNTWIDESAGERWFCSEAEAVAAGWRKSKE